MVPTYVDQTNETLADQVLETTKKMEAKLSQFRKDMQKRKFNKAELSKPLFTKNSYPILQSQDVVDQEEVNQGLPDEGGRRPVSKRPRKLCPLTVEGLSSEMRRKRTDTYKVTIREWADEQQCSAVELLGLLLHQLAYNSNRKVALAGWEIFKSSFMESPKRLPINEAMALQNR